jgi:hypothetical protein
MHALVEACKDITCQSLLCPQDWQRKQTHTHTHTHTQPSLPPSPILGMSLTLGHTETSTSAYSMHWMPPGMTQLWMNNQPTRLLLTTHILLEHPPRNAQYLMMTLQL